jgi:hypothetical protein
MWSVIKQLVRGKREEKYYKKKKNRQPKEREERETERVRPKREREGGRQWERETFVCQVSDKTNRDFASQLTRGREREEGKKEGEELNKSTQVKEKNTFLNRKPRLCSLFSLFSRQKI